MLSTPPASSANFTRLAAALSDPLGTAASLVKFALDAGGVDNITAVLIPFPPVSSAT